MTPPTPEPVITVRLSRSVYVDDIMSGCYQQADIYSDDTLVDTVTTTVSSSYSVFFFLREDGTLSMGAKQTVGGTNGLSIWYHDSVTATGTGSFYLKTFVSTSQLPDGWDNTDVRSVLVKTGLNDNLYSPITADDIRYGRIKGTIA